MPNTDTSGVCCGGCQSAFFFCPPAHESTTMGDEETGYRWEGGYEKTWESIEEDGDGMLDKAISDIIEKSRRKRIEERRAAGNVRLGIMRHVYIVLDLSACMLDMDMKPNRLHATFKLFEKFVDSFFDANPMSQLGWIGTRNKKAERMFEMSGNPRKQVEFVGDLKTKYTCSGEPSFQNALELAQATLKHMPSHTSREILVIAGSLTSCDPGDIHSTIKSLRENGIRCSVIALGAEVRAFKLLTMETGGTFNVTLDDVHFHDLLTSHVEPPPIKGKYEASCIKMGFPQRNDGEQAGMCLCHIDVPAQSTFSTGGYICPQCKNKYCELPVECKVCGLTLVSAPHLARSFLHIFPLDPFEEIEPYETRCGGCNKWIPDGNKHIYRCKLCHFKFCLDCDLYLHEVLHCCPGCAALNLSLQIAIRSKP